MVHGGIALGFPEIRTANNKMKNITLKDLLKFDNHFQ